MKNLQGNELRDFAKKSHKYYMENLQFGNLDRNIIQELSNLIYCIDYCSFKQDQEIKDSLTWLKENESNMIFK